MPDPIAAAAFEFRCLGPVSLTRPDGERVRFRTRKQMALLLLLAMRPGRPYPREQLIELLWSDDDEVSARHSLSQSISLINKNLGVEAVTGIGRDQVVLQEGLIRLDAMAFEERVAAKQFAEARDVWHGNLLEGLWIQRAPNFDRWLDEQRQRLLRSIRRVLHALVESTRAEGDWEAMRATAEAILELDALDEGAMLGYLESLSLHGDRTLALRRFREFEARLKDELDAEPGTALRGWMKRHRKGDGAPAEAVAAPSVPSGRVSETIVLPAARPVFGRNAEFAVLWEAWEAARVGNGSFIIVEGGIGIGKTALASKLVNQVHVAGGSACFVRCFRSEKSVPFAPISALIRQLSRLPGFVALGDTWIGELTRLVPELRERYPNAPQPMAVDDSARYRLCDATLHAAECVADEHPLLVVVDDIQDADEATLALVHYFGRQASSQPTVLLCVARHTEDRSELQRVFFDTARSAGLARFLELAALPDPDIARIVKQVLAQRGLEVPEWALEKVTALAKGNPLHAGEIAMAIPGRDGQPTDAWLQELKEQSRGEESFEKTSTERLNQLAAQARHVAAALAVAGRPLSDHELAAVTALPVAELAAATTALEDAHFIRRSGSTLGFAHEQYFLSANASVAEEQRREIHLRLAKHLVKSAADNPAARYEVARHYERAHRFKEARAQALSAQRYARSLGAVREQAAALQLVRRVTGGYDADIGIGLGTCLLELRDFEQLGEICRSAQQQNGLTSRQLNDFRYLDIAASYHSGNTSIEDTKDTLVDLLAGGRSDFTHALDARMLLMQSADRSGAHSLARRTARTIRKVRTHGGKSASAHRLSARGFVATKYYWPKVALPLFEASLQRAQAANDWALEQHCRAGLGVVLRQLGRYRDSIEQLEYGLALARRTLNPQAEANRLMDIGNAEMALGNYDRARAKFVEVSKIDDRFPKWAFRAYRFSNSAELHLLTGDPERASAEFMIAVDHALRAGVWPVATMACGGVALCAQRLNRLDDLRSWGDRLLSMRAGRERVLHDRWLIEGAVAWHSVLILGRTDEAMTSLQTASLELAKRDVDHWLHLAMETIRIREHVEGRRADAERETLALHASKHSALGVLAATRSVE